MIACAVTTSTVAPVVPAVPVVAPVVVAGVAVTAPEEFVVNVTVAPGVVDPVTLTTSVLPEPFTTNAVPVEVSVATTTPVVAPVVAPVAAPVVAPVAPVAAVVPVTVDVTGAAVTVPDAVSVVKVTVEPIPVFPVILTT